MRSCTTNATVRSSQTLLVYAEPTSETRDADEAVIPSVYGKKKFPKQSKAERGKFDQEAQEGEGPSRQESYIEKKD